MGWSQGTAKLGLPAGVAETTGVDEGSGTSWAPISIEGKGTGAASPAPRLTAQCTKDTGGKMRFGWTTDWGGEEPVGFVAPWKATKEDLYPPTLPKAMVTMEFLGYTKVKPVKRQWEALPEPRVEWRYAAPGAASSNLEEVSYYMQYLRSLPTLRLTRDGATVEFDTAKWQVALHLEPLCRAGGF